MSDRVKDWANQKMDFFFQEKVSLEYAKFEHDQWEQTWRDAKIESYESEDVRRSLMFLKNLGTSALPPADLSKV